MSKAYFDVVNGHECVCRCVEDVCVCMCVSLCVHGIIMIHECIAANLILTSTGAGLILKSCMLLCGRRERGE